MKHSPIVHFQRAAPPAADPFDPVLVDRARHELAFTALRRRKLPSRRVGDIDWLILLELFVAHAEGRAVPTKQLAGDAAPMTTRLRYLDQLQRQGMITRTVDERDARATLVRATETGVVRIASILAEASIGGALLPEPRSAGARR